MTISIEEHFNYKERDQDKELLVLEGTILIRQTKYTHKKVHLKNKWIWTQSQPNDSELHTVKNGLSQRRLSGGGDIGTERRRLCWRRFGARLPWRIASCSWDRELRCQANHTHTQNWGKCGGTSAFFPIRRALFGSFLVWPFSLLSLKTHRATSQLLRATPCGMLSRHGLRSHATRTAFPDLWPFITNDLPGVRFLMAFLEFRS